MSTKTLYYLFLVVVLIGFADSMYLSLTAFLDVSPVCGPLHGCETVATSKYSKLYGVPLAYLGVLYYAFGASIASMLRTSARVRTLALAYAGVGSLASIAFIYVQVVLVQALCVYCVISAIATFALLLVTILLLRAHASTSVS